MPVSVYQSAVVGCILLQYLMVVVCHSTKLLILVHTAKDYATKEMTDDAMTSSVNPAIDGAVAPLINIIY